MLMGLDNAHHTKGCLENSMIWLCSLAISCWASAAMAVVATTSARIILF